MTAFAAKRRHAILAAAACMTVLLPTPVMAADRESNIAMAVALLDVAKDNCADRVSVDEDLKVHLMMHFHEYDIGGLLSSISGPLNIFYEDFAQQAKSSRAEFCSNAPAYAASTGYPVLLGDR